MSENDHDRRCQHWTGLLLIESGAAFAFTAFGVVRVERRGDSPEEVFEDAGGRFRCEVLTLGEQAFLYEPIERMAVGIISAFAGLWVAEEPPRAARTPQNPNAAKGGRPNRREKKQLWQDIEQ